MLNTFRTITGYPVSKTYYPAADIKRTKDSSASKPNYDSSSFSVHSDESERFHMDAVSRLSKEIRVSTPTSRVQELKDAVASGSYQIDANEIAKSILFHWEA